MFELATRLHIPIDELGDRLSIAELQAWQIYLSEPSGDRRIDWNAAMIVKAIYDIGAGLSGKQGPTTEQCLLKFSKEDVEKNNALAVLSIFGKIIPEDAKQKMIAGETK